MVETTYYTHVPSPIGRLLLAGTDTALTTIALPGDSAARLPRPEWTRSVTPFTDAIRQLEAYFAGELRRFRLTLAPVGTPFQQVVWRALSDIPYGETVSYAEVARRVGRARAVRAVGAANGQNPIAIIVPCHRVIGSDGRLTGYGGGLPVKQALLALEQRHRAPLLF